MIEHVSVPISDYKQSRQFYLEVLKPLGYVLGSDHPSNAAGFIEGGHTSFWIVKKKKPVQPIHVALLASSKDAVHQFHTAALKEFIRHKMPKEGAGCVPTLHFNRSKLDVPDEPRQARRPASRCS
jgi:hypothetical protein